MYDMVSWFIKHIHNFLFFLIMPPTPLFVYRRKVQTKLIRKLKDVQPKKIKDQIFWSEIIGSSKLLCIGNKISLILQCLISSMMGFSLFHHFSNLFSYEKQLYTSTRWSVCLSKTSFSVFKKCCKFYCVYIYLHPLARERQLTCTHPPE